MATVETRTRADESKSYRLKWRYGGKRDGAPQSVTYPDIDDAKRMKGAVEALGHLVYADDPKVVTFELVTGQKSVTYIAPTFGVVAERYIASRTSASARTRDEYRQTLARVPDLKNGAIEAITDDELRLALNGIVDAGGDATSIHKLISSVFKYAVNKAMLPNGNPCAGVQAPKKRVRTANFLASNEAASLLQACREVPVVGSHLADFVDVVLGTGLRISEACGLIVDDVHVSDVRNAWIDVTRQLSRDGKSRVPVKSRASQRRVVLDLDTAVLLAKLVKGKPNTEPVFVDPVDGGWWRQTRINNQWAKARTVAQKRGLAKTPRIHDLRHTHAAWLLTDGVSLLAVSRRLGHESIKVTADIYGHLLPEADDAIRVAIAQRRTAMTVKPLRRAA
jgi:site-specific recombinase XerD